MGSSAYRQRDSDNTFDSLADLIPLIMGSLPMISSILNSPADNSQAKLGELSSLLGNVEPETLRTLALQLTESMPELKNLLKKE